MADFSNELILPSGGYEKLTTFKLAQLIYDITVHFVKLYVDKKSRTCDQMIQAARSGVQNIAEGSIDAATSVKMELNLYNIARGSLIELLNDYQDFLRQNNISEWNKKSLLYKEFVTRRVRTTKEFRDFIQWAISLPDTPEYVQDIPYKAVLVANATLLLINSATYLLRCQIKSKAERFLAEGGFSERMSRIRRGHKNGDD